MGELFCNTKKINGAGDRRLSVNERDFNEIQKCRKKRKGGVPMVTSAILHAH